MGFPGGMVGPFSPSGPNRIRVTAWDFDQTTEVEKGGAGAETVIT